VSSRVLRKKEEKCENGYGHLKRTTEWKYEGVIGETLSREILGKEGTDLRDL